MCLSRTRSPSPPPSIRLARRTPRQSYSSTIPAVIVTRSPSTTTKRTSHRPSTSLNTIDTVVSSPRTSRPSVTIQTARPTAVRSDIQTVRPSVTIQTARPTAVTPDIQTVRPTGYRRRIIIEDDRRSADIPAAKSSDRPRRPSATAATVAAYRIPRDDTGGLPPTPPEPPRTETTRPPPDRQHRHTWSADPPLSTKKIRSRGEQSVRSAPVPGRGDRDRESDSPRRITDGRGSRSDRFSAVVPRRGESVRRTRSASRSRRGREDVDDKGEMEVLYRSRRKGFLGF